MNFKKLLLATSVAALLASPALAADFSVNTFTTPAGQIESIANELADPLEQLTGEYSFTFESAVGLPEGTNLITITLPAGVTFSDDADSLDVDITGSTTVNSSSANLYGASGEEGDSEVTFRVDVNAMSDVDLIVFTMDLEVAVCPTSTTSQAGSLVIDIIDGDLLLVQEGTLSEDGDSLIQGECGDALSSEMDATTAAFIELPDYTDVSSAGVVGTLNFEIDGDYHVTVGTDLAAGDIDSIEFDVVFDDASGFEEIASPTPAGYSAPTVTIDLGGAVTETATQSATDPKVFSFEVTNATNIGLLIDGTADTISISSNGIDQIIAQNLSLENTVVNFDATATPALDASATGATGALDTLEREGADFGTYDWVTETGRNTINYFRVTGFDQPATDPVIYTVTFSNAHGGDEFEETFKGTIPVTALNAKNGELMLHSDNYFGLSPWGGADTDVATMLAGFKKADISFLFETSESLDVDRLMLSGQAGGVVSAYGNDAITVDPVTTVSVNGPTTITTTGGGSSSTEGDD